MKPNMKSTTRIEGSQIIIPLALLLCAVNFQAHGQERLCPDGKRSYFGVCPDDGNQSRPPPAPAPPTTPAPIPVSKPLPDITTPGSRLPACPAKGYFQNCFGTYPFINGEKYVGEFKDEKLHGQGTYTFSSGAKYVGEYKYGLFNGQGALYRANGSVVNTGIWADGQFVPSASVQQPRNTPEIGARSAP